MTQLDPVDLFRRIASDIPASLHSNFVVTGSLAAAYEYRTQLQGHAINTKDADLVIHPAGEVQTCAEMTNNLLTAGWTRTEKCGPQASPKPADQLWAIRLYPPESKDYFIEFLNIPAVGQAEAKRWIEMKLEDGWYGLPSFKYMGVVVLDRRRSTEGIEYACPAMMALANLLAHQTVGESQIESGMMKGVLRSAKDLGRVISLAHLAGREATESWIPQWQNALQSCFPQEAEALRKTLGNGLVELINDPAAMQDAYQTTDIGLLNGMNVTTEQLTITAERLLNDVVEPMRE